MRTKSNSSFYKAATFALFVLLLVGIASAGDNIYYHNYPSPGSTRDCSLGYYTQDLLEDPNDHASRYCACGTSCMSQEGFLVHTYSADSGLLQHFEGTFYYYENSNHNPDGHSTIADCYDWSGGQAWCYGYHAPETEMNLMDYKDADPIDDYFVPLGNRISFYDGDVQRMGIVYTGYIFVTPSESAITIDTRDLYLHSEDDNCFDGSDVSSNRKWANFAGGGDAWPDGYVGYSIYSLSDDGTTTTLLPDGDDAGEISDGEFGMYVSMCDNGDPIGGDDHEDFTGYEWSIPVEPGIYPIYIGVAYESGERDANDFAYTIDIDNHVFKTADPAIIEKDDYVAIGGDLDDYGNEFFCEYYVDSGAGNKAWREDSPEGSRCCGDDPDDDDMAFDDYFCMHDGDTWYWYSEEPDFFCEETLKGDFLLGSDATVADIRNTYSDGQDGCCGDDVSCVNKEEAEMPPVGVCYEDVPCSDLSFLEYATCEMAGCNMAFLSCTGTASRPVGRVSTEGDCDGDWYAMADPVFDDGMCIAQFSMFTYPVGDFSYYTDESSCNNEDYELVGLWGIPLGDDYVYNAGYWLESGEDGICTHYNASISSCDGLIQSACTPPCMWLERPSATLNCQIFNKNECLANGDYCKLDLTGGDFAYITSDDKYFCYNDEKPTNTGNIIYDKNNNDWKWWWAQEGDARYLIHEVEKHDYIANGESWYQCDVGAPKGDDTDQLIADMETFPAAATVTIDFCDEIDYFIRDIYEVYSENMPNDAIPFFSFAFLDENTCIDVGDGTATAADEFIEYVTHWLENEYDGYIEPSLIPVIASEIAGNMKGCCYSSTGMTEYDYDFLTTAGNQCSSIGCYYAPGQGPEDYVPSLPGSQDFDVEDYLNNPPQDEVVQDASTCDELARQLNLPVDKCADDEMCVPFSDDSFSIGLSGQMCCVSGNCRQETTSTCQQLGGYIMYDDYLGLYTCDGKLVTASNTPIEGCCIGNVELLDVSSVDVYNLFSPNEAFVCYEGPGGRSFMGECCYNNNCENTMTWYPSTSYLNWDNGRVFTQGSQLHTIISNDKIRKDSGDAEYAIFNLGKNFSIDGAPHSDIIAIPDSRVSYDYDWSMYDHLTFDVYYKGPQELQEVVFDNDNDKTNGEVFRAIVRDHAIIPPLVRKDENDAEREILPRYMWHRVTIPFDTPITDSSISLKRTIDLSSNSYYLTLPDCACDIDSDDDDCTLSDIDEPCLDHHYQYADVYDYQRIRDVLDQKVNTIYFTFDNYEEAFGTETNLLLDNFVLHEEGETDNWYCAGPYRKWLPDLVADTDHDGDGYTVFKEDGSIDAEDIGPEMIACNNQLSFKWTGTVCCGAQTSYPGSEDPSSQDYYTTGEYYIDTEGACWGGIKMKDGDTVPDVYGGNADAWPHILYASVDDPLEGRLPPQFWSCDTEMPDIVDVHGNQFTTDAEPAAGWSQIRNVPIFSIVGDYYCDPSHDWLPVDNLRKVKVLAAKLYEIAGDNFTLTCDNFSLPALLGQPLNSTMINILRTSIGEISPNDGFANACILENRTEDKTTIVIGIPLPNPPEGMTNTEHMNAFVEDLYGTFYPLHYSTQTLPNCALDDQADPISTYLDLEENPGEFFSECYGSPNEGLHIYYNNPMHLALLSMHDEVSKGFLVTFWERVRDVFRRLFQNDDDENPEADQTNTIPLKLNYQVDFSHLYIAEEGDTSIIGMMELDTTSYTPTWYGRIDYFNLSTAIAPLVEGYRAFGLTEQQMRLCSDGPNQTVYFEIAQDSDLINSFDWRYLAANLRLQDIGEPGFFITSDDQCWLHNGNIETGEQCDDTVSRVREVVALRGDWCTQNPNTCDEKSGAWTNDCMECINGRLSESNCGIESYVLFATSQAYNGNLGGLMGADEKCREAATSAGFPRADAVKAVISTNAVNARDRFHSGVDVHMNDPTKSPLGTTDDLFYTSGGFYNNDASFFYTEHRVLITNTDSKIRAWTGSGDDGIVRTTDNMRTCNGWTQGTTDYVGQYGMPTNYETPGSWLNQDRMFCLGEARLWCMVPDGAAIIPGPVCGDGTQEGDEECDDSNLINGDGCNSYCEEELCSLDGDAPEVTSTCGSYEEPILSQCIYDFVTDCATTSDCATLPYCDLVEPVQVSNGGSCDEDTDCISGYCTHDLVNYNNPDISYYCCDETNCAFDGACYPVETQITYDGDPQNPAGDWECGTDGWWNQVS